MKTSDNRKAALLVLAAISLSFIGLASPAAGAQTLDITGLRIFPNPGYACENTTISFNVTNNLGTMVDLATVHVDAKSAIGGMSWQSDITMLADGGTSFQSFTWTYPPEGTYDVSISVFGAGQIAQKSGQYTVLPCAAHVYIGSVTIVKSVQAPEERAIVSVEVGNDGHAPAYNTTVAVQATGAHPEKTRYFLGSTVIPEIASGGGSHPEFLWAPVPAPGVYTVTVMAIDQNGVMMSKDASLVVDLQTRPNTVEIKGISVDSWPPMQGRESIVTVDLMFRGNWSGIPVTVKAYADGPSSYPLLNITLKEVMVSSLVPVNFSWPATIEPGEYDLTVTAMFNPKEYTISKIAVTQMAKQKQWSPANFRLELKGLRMSPYPPMPGQNSTVTVEVANTGDLDAPPARLTVTAEGPAFYDLGTRTTPSTSFGSMVRMDFPWPQPVVPGEYIIRAFLEDIGGNQSDLKSTFVLPHVLDANLSIVNGSATYNYYYFGAQPNNTCDHNVTVTVRETQNSTAAATGLNNPTTGAIAGVAVGGVVSIASVLAYGMLKRKGQMTDVQSNPMYKENAAEGQNPMHQDKGAAAENPLYIHERMVHGVHRGEGVAEPQEASLVGGALPGGAVISSAVSSVGRESPSRPSTGQTAVRESPTKASLGQTAVRESPTMASTGVKAPRDSASGQATGKRQHGPVGVTDEDGDIGSDARMAINEKGLPGPKKPSANRLAGDGTEPLDPDDDGDGSPDALSKKGYDYYQAQSQLNPAGKLRESPTRATAASTRDSVSSVAQTAGGSGDDMPTESVDLSRKGWDGTIKGVTAEETAQGREAAHPVISKLRESPTKASGQASGIAIDEPGAHVAAPRDVATGQSSGKRFGMGGETTPEAPTGRSDYAIKEQGVKMMSDEGGRHTPFQNKVAPEEATGIDGIKGHRDVGGYRAAEAPPAPPAQSPDGRVSGSTNDYSGGGSRAQDHNSSRSNKTSSIAAPEGGGGSGTGEGGTGTDGKLTAGDLEAQKHTKTGHVTLMK